MASPTTGLESAFRKTDALLRALRTRHLYIGGLAVLATGEPRMTLDIDLIVFIPRTAPGPFLDAAARRGFTVSKRVALTDAAERGACMVRYRGVAVDLIFASTELEESAWRRRKRRTLFGRTVDVPSPEDLILLKLIPGRPRDLEDVRGIAASVGNRLDRKYLAAWARKLCDEAEDFRVLRLLKELALD